jgi:uncharacterized membrane protein
MGGPLVDIRATEHALLTELRRLRRLRRGEDLAPLALPALTRGQRVADTVAATMGSWRFIIIQSTLLLA